ncbi:hypothetical protein AN936_23355 (plasmid) [Sphingopyxis macrogoltabida]|uniref:Uncharacterized protein n=1 Tax=Sphingopyxis macrogoltabida TaxID=33050 RepID=A0A0N9V5B7_SPHMC|nr:hypothetical protein AN936_23355 [Sphingopyxis macrogoltabida]
MDARGPRDSVDFGNFIEARDVNGDDTAIARVVKRLDAAGDGRTAAEWNGSIGIAVAPVEERRNVGFAARMSDDVWRVAIRWHIAWVSAGVGP